MKIKLHKYRSENVARFFADKPNCKYIGFHKNLGVDKFITEDLDGGAFCVEEVVED